MLIHLYIHGIHTISYEAPKACLFFIQEYIVARKALFPTTSIIRDPLDKYLSSVPPESQPRLSPHLFSNTLHSFATPDPFVTEKMATPEIPGASNAREARFLASQSARTGGRMQNTPSSTQDDRRNAFWRAFKARRADLGGRIDALMSPKGGGGAQVGTSALARDMFVTASQRNAKREEIDGLLEGVAHLRRACLGRGFGADGATGSSEAVGEGGDPVFDSDALDSLPEGDLRLLTEELSRLSTKVNEAREIICPREVFTFKRYRAAMAQKVKEKGNGTNMWKDEGKREAKSTDTVQVSITDKGSNVKGEDIEKYGISIVDKENCSIVVEADGSIMVCGLNEKEETIKKSSNIRTENPSGNEFASRASVLIRNLTGCRIHL